MPDCDFYADGDDYRQVIDFVSAETSCRVFEIDGLLRSGGVRLKDSQTAEPREPL